MTGYSGMLETAECQRLRNVRDCGMSGTAARQWWSLEGRGVAAGDAIVVADSEGLVPAGPGPAVHHHCTAVGTPDVPPAVGLIREKIAILVGGTRV